MITETQAASVMPHEDLPQLSCGDLSRAWAIRFISDDDFATEIERRFGVQVPARRLQ